MKRIFTFLLAILLFTGAFAQAPEKMSYQAVIRNSSNQLVTNQQVGMQISILQGSADGTIVYMETQNPTTNANGLISVEIGTGSANGDFSAINWANGPFFIQTETDPSGGTNYTITGTSQLLSVPYALHAKTAETISGTIPETDPVFKVWDKSSGISITESQISNLKNYIQEESDPDFKASPAGSITDAGSGAVITTVERTKLAAVNTNAEQNVQANWNETDNTADAFIKNKPAIPTKTSELTNDEGFLTAETDPDFNASFAASITDAGSGAVITTVERTKLAALNANAEQNVQANWNETNSTSDAFIQNKPTIPSKTSELTNDKGFLTTETDPDFNASPAASIADSGSGAVITGTERAKLAALDVDAEQNVQANWNEPDNTSDDFIKNKPSIPTKTSDLTNDEGFLTSETDPDFNASPAASITDSGSGAVITGTERTKLAALNVDAEQNVQANWNETDNTSDAFIQNKPSIPTKTSELTNDEGFLTSESDPDFHASSAASITDAGSGAVITSDERTKLAALNIDAEQNVQANWNETDNTSDDFIKNKPSIPTKTSDLTNDEGFLTSETDPDFNASSAASITDAGSGAVITSDERTKLAALDVAAEQNVQANWNETDNTSDAFIKNKPSIPTKTSDLTNDEGFLTAETDPVFNASPAASVTNAGSGSIITDEERKRWNNAIPDTIMHPENGIYEGGLIGSFEIYETVLTEGLESTNRKHVLVFSVPSNGSIEQRFSYVDVVYSASGVSTSLEEQLRMVLTKEFDYTRKPYDKSYTIYIKVYKANGTLYFSKSVSPEYPATTFTDDNAHTMNISLVSEGTVRITLDRIDPLEYLISYVTQSYGYIPYAYVDNFSGQETQLHYSVMNYGKAKASYAVVVRDCSQSMSVVSANKFILESKESVEATKNLYFPNLTSYTGSINLWIDVIGPTGMLYDEVQVFFNRVAADEEAVSEE